MVEIILKIKKICYSYIMVLKVCLCGFTYNKNINKWNWLPAT